MLEYWHRLTLARQFALLSSVLIGIAMAIVGTWVSSEIEARVLHQVAISRAVYLESFIAPHSQDLATSHEIGPDSRRAISSLFSETPFGRRVVSFKIWRPGGQVAHASNPNIIGKSFPVMDRLTRAFNGEVTAHIEQPNDEEHEYERRMGLVLFEIYAPVRERGSQRIIAVGELYEVAEELKAELQWATAHSWGIVGLITIGLVVALFSIVHRGSSTITQQRETLVERVAELSRLLDENNDLQSRIRLANANAANDYEQLLRRVGADLHDGTAQLISLALLLLDGLKDDYASIAERDDSLIKIERALSDSLKEIRVLSAGLAVPELETVSPEGVIEIAAHAHELRTGTSVHCELGELPQDLSLSMKVCLYRFAQEGLSNAFRHAHGRGQTVRAGQDGDTVFVEVADLGPGIPQSREFPSTALGLRGLRNRVESLGGRLELTPGQRMGTRLVARFKYHKGGVE